MRERDINRSNLNSAVRQTAGHLGPCRYCGQTVYWCLLAGRWIPFESWVAENCDPGDWRRHECRPAPGTQQHSQLTAIAEPASERTIVEEILEWLALNAAVSAQAS